MVVKMPVKIRFMVLFSILTYMNLHYIYYNCSKSRLFNLAEYKQIILLLFLLATNFLRLNGGSMVLVKHKT